MKLKVGNWYIIKDCLDNKLHIAQYYGREEGFECCVCNHGNNAYCFNIYYDEYGYETWGYGREHMPEILKDLGKSDAVIINDQDRISKELEG